MAMVAAVVVVLVAVFGSRPTAMTSRQPALPLSRIISSAPSAVASPPRGTAPPDGMRIKIPDLGVDMPVVAGDGYNAPLFKAVLYPSLTLPGSGSRSMIYAHARNGMFAPLFRARIGQTIEVDRPSWAPLQYRIAEYHPHWSSTDLRWLQPLNQEQLVLVTCTTYSENDPRIVVVANPA